MTLRAILWALEDAPVEDARAVLVLAALANHAHDDGTAAFPGRARMAAFARCSTDTVDRKIAELLEAGLIRLGDQQLVEHYRADRRPVVYDLNVAGPQDAAPSRTGPQKASSGAATVRHKPKDKPNPKTPTDLPASPEPARAGEWSPPPPTFRQLVEAAAHAPDAAHPRSTPRRRPRQPTPPAAARAQP